MKLLPDCQVLKFVEAAGLPHWTAEAVVPVSTRTRSVKSSQREQAIIRLFEFVSFVTVTVAMED